MLLIVGVAAERVLELFLSLRNGNRALARGGIETGQRHYRWMVAIHTLFLISCVAEVQLLERPFHPLIGPVALGLAVAAMGLRYWAISTLGEHWNTRVIVVPDEPVVRDGPYRWLRHPNYVAVIVEIAALPLIHGAWITAVLFSAANAIILAVRIRCEEQTLAGHSDYGEVFEAHGRFVPGGNLAGRGGE